MGYKYEVWAWVIYDEEGFQYIKRWEGQSLLGLIKNIIKAKRDTGSGCIKILWRS